MIREATFGNMTPHPHMAITIFKLAQLHHAEEDLTTAHSLYQRALEMLETLFGPHHRTVAAVLERLAVVLRDLHRMEEARAPLHRSHNILQADFGAGHEDGHHDATAAMGHLSELWDAQYELPRHLERTKSTLVTDEHAFAATRKNPLTNQQYVEFDISHIAPVPVSLGHTKNVVDGNTTVVSQSGRVDVIASTGHKTRTLPNGTVKKLPPGPQKGILDPRTSLQMAMSMTGKR